MYKKQPNFVDRCLAGSALLEDIHDDIDAWHESDDPRSLPEFLGLTDDEYALWVEKPVALKLILYARKANSRITKAWLNELCRGNGLLAPDAPSTAEAREVLQWLQATQRIA